MKRFILHLAIAIPILLISTSILFIYWNVYTEQPKTLVVCSFVGWDTTGQQIKMKLKCGDKEYVSNDKKLIIWHIDNPTEYIRGAADQRSKVWKINQ
jgi:hypothetical protein